MQQVSQQWKDIYQRPLANQAYTRLTVGLTDADADMNKVGSGIGVSYSMAEQVTEQRTKDIPRYLTLEQNQWLLDETVQLYWAGRDTGFVSDDISDNTCAIDVTFVISFSKVFTKMLPGFEIIFDRVNGEYAVDFTVDVYNGSSLVTSEPITDNRESERTVNVDFANYNKIEIHITKWCLPNRRARIENITLGIGWIFTENDLLSFSHEMIMSPVNEELPKSEIVFEIDNTEGLFDILEESGISKYLQSRQKIDVHYGLKFDDDSVEWITGGTFYLYDWSAQYGSVAAQFKARDKIIWLQEIFVDNVGIEPLGDKFQRVLDESPLTELDYVLDLGDSASIEVGYLPDTSYANSLQYLCQAASIGFWIDRTGVFHFEPLNATVQDYIVNNDNLYEWPFVEKATRLKSINVEIYDYEEKNKSTVTSFIFDIPDSDITMQNLGISNPLVISQANALSIAEYILSDKIDTFTVESVFRADPRIDGGDMFVQALKNKTFNLIIRQLTYRFTGAFRATAVAGIPTTIVTPQTEEIAIMPQTTTVDLSEWVISNQPIATFTLEAEMIPGGIKYITWSAEATQISSNVSIVSPDTITLNQTGNGLDLEVVITGNNEFALSGNTSTAFGFSTNTLVLTAKTSDGYSRTYTVNITRNIQVTDITIDPVDALDFNVMTAANEQETNLPSMNRTLTGTTLGAPDVPIRFEVKTRSNFNAVGSVGDDDFIFSHRNTQEARLDIKGRYSYISKWVNIWNPSFNPLDPPHIELEEKKYYSYSTAAVTIRAVAPNGVTKDYALAVTNPTNPYWAPYYPEYKRPVYMPNLPGPSSMGEGVEVEFDCPYPMNLSSQVYNNQVTNLNEYTISGLVGETKGSAYVLVSSGENVNTEKKSRIEVGYALYKKPNQGLNMQGTIWASRYNQYRINNVTWFKGPAPITFILEINR